MPERHTTPLEGRHAIVTGGGGGIGRACAQALSAAGATVSICGRRPEPLEETTSLLASPGLATCADVTDAASIARFETEAEAAHGSADILICNAGAAESAPFARTEPEIWDRMLSVNLTSLYNTIQPLWVSLRKRENARIIVISSTAGLKGYPYVSAYCAAKHGAIGLVRGLALEAARTSLTVNAVCPGFTETDLLEASLDAIANTSGRSREDARQQLASGNPQGRFVTPHEVAAAVVWLALPSSGSVTGQAISISGGEVS